MNNMTYFSVLPSELLDELICTLHISDLYYAITHPDDDFFSIPVFNRRDKLKLWEKLCKVHIIFVTLKAVNKEAFKHALDYLIKTKQTFLISKLSDVVKIKECLESGEYWGINMDVIFQKAAIDCCYPTVKYLLKKYSFKDEYVKHALYLIRRYYADARKSSIITILYLLPHVKDNEEYIDYLFQISLQNHTFTHLTKIFKRGYKFKEKYFKYMAEWNNLTYNYLQCVRFLYDSCPYIDFTQLLSQVKHNPEIVDFLTCKLGTNKRLKLTCIN